MLESQYIFYIYKDGKEDGFKCRRYTWWTSHDPRPSFESFTCFVRSPNTTQKLLKFKWRNSFMIYESTIFLDQFSRNLEFAKQINRIAIISKRKLIFYWRKIKIISFTFFVIFILVFFFSNTFNEYFTISTSLQI